MAITPESPDWAIPSHPHALMRPLISVEEADAVLRSSTPDVVTEQIALPDAVGRVLAQPVVAEGAQPPFDRVMMDGVATRWQPVMPAVLRVAGGGVVWGIGAALHEHTEADHRFGRFMNRDFAQYHVSVNADIHDVDVLFVEEDDRVVSSLGAKGVGEIGLVGVSAAISNAIFHATGKRIRSTPITPVKVMR